ncbi:hypothetical protein MBAV_000480 [Candidatus Magnetobacterium bavaricum]|uniref:Uncharacterized protein n=1 Tax=Candidatus Magnetobacterium bavaricum TaxID=29290 RepID=A0A0F3GZJ7_9BACT|nr:hypothetical protein MBAV_000480 [Candidatus Magnetobacterium bavaricum]
MAPSPQRRPNYQSLHIYYTIRYIRLSRYIKAKKITLFLHLRRHIAIFIVTIKSPQPN